MTRLDLFEIGLSKSCLSGWHVAPLLDNRLLDLPWVGAGPGADLLGDVNALLSRLEERHQFGDVLALLLGSRLQVSSGTSETTVSVLSKHSSGPGFRRHPEGPQSSRGTFLHSVSGLYFLTLFLSLVQTCFGHLVHFFSVVYPWVTSSHFSS